jgi:hypothetical protein
MDTALADRKMTAVLHLTGTDPNSSIPGRSTFEELMGLIRDFMEGQRAARNATDNYTRCDMIDPTRLYENAFGAAGASCGSPYGQGATSSRQSGCGRRGGDLMDGAQC